MRILEWGRPPELVEVPVPEPGPGEVRVRVAGCGLCHSDLTMAAIPRSLGESLGWQMPFTLGHETAGWIDAVGTGVAGWSEGDPVLLASPTSCGTCRSCRRAHESACPNGAAGRGYGRDGGLAEAVLVSDPDRSLFPLGDLDPRDAGPLADAGATSQHAVTRVVPHLGPDSAVLVIGAGGLGMFTIQLLRAVTDVPVIVADPDPLRRRLAHERGAHHTIAETTAAAVGEMTDRPIDAVVDLVGVDATISTGLEVLAPAGALALVGAGGGTLRRPWWGALPPDACVFAVRGSDLSDTRRVAELAAAGELVLDLEPFRLDDAAAAFAAVERGGLRGRAVVRPVEPPSTRSTGR